MTKKEFKKFVNEALENGAVWFRTNEEDQEPGGILCVEDDELVFNYIDGCEDYRYEIDEDDIKSLVDEMWQEQSPKKWEQIDEDEYEEIEEEYFNS